MDKNDERAGEVMMDLIKGFAEKADEMEKSLGASKEEMLSASAMFTGACIHIMAMHVPASRQHYFADKMIDNVATALRDDVHKRIDEMGRAFSGVKH